jgi:hypothetical protein
VLIIIKRWKTWSPIAEANRPRVGVGENTVIRRALIDKNAASARTFAC